MWHDRLGHPHHSVVTQVLNDCMISINSKNKAVCSSCCLGKSHKLPFSSSTTEYHSPLELVHSDLWGPAPITSSLGYSYYIVFIDAFSRYTWLFLLKQKSDALTAFLHFKAQAELQFNTKLKMLQSIGGGEYSPISSFCLSNGIIHRKSCPHTPQQNRISERKHRHITETALTLLAKASMPLKYWDEAVCTSVYLINRLPSSTLSNLSPFFETISLQTSLFNFQSFWVYLFSIHQTLQ